MIEGFVLAGGASSRMGRPKAGLSLGASSLLECAAAALSKISNGDVTAIVPHEFQFDRSEYPGFSIAHDVEISGLNVPLRAPIVGLHSAMQLASSPWIAVLAVDLPFVTTELLLHLADQISDEIDVVVPVQDDGNLQPLCAMYRVDAVLPVVVEAVRSRDVSLRAVISKVKARKVAFGEIADLPGSENFFRNLNTPGDYQAALSVTDAA